jgi:hypothetical protein
MTTEDREMLKDMHACLVGNKIKGQRGLIDRMDICENKVDTLEKTKSNKWDWSKIFKIIKVVKTGI